MKQQDLVFDKQLQPKKRRLLRALVLAAGNISRACQVCDLSRETHYTWLEKDELYRREFERARELATDRLEDEMIRRAFEGVRKPLMHAGKQAQIFATDEDGNPIQGDDGKFKSVPAIVREYSDTLIIFALKALRPEKYRERVDYKGTVEHTGQVDIRAAVMQVAQKLPEESRAILARELLKLEKAG